MRKLGTLAAFAVGATILAASGAASASSHREAPFITKMPKVDNTDFYAFRSYEAGRGEYVTIIANYSPLQGAYGGPNFFSMDENALYEIHIDNTGDGKEDLTFQFRFQNFLTKDCAALNGAIPAFSCPDNTGNSGMLLDVGGKKNSIPLYNVGALDQGQAFRNVKETYGIKVVKGDRRTGTASDVTKSGGGPVFDKPADNIGTKTFPAGNDYATYANAHVYDIDVPGCTPPTGTKPRVFVGQRQEGFAVLLGNIFDLINGPLDATGLLNPTGGNVPNPIGQYNVTSIALELPIACVKGSVNNALGNIVGTWATASVRQARALNPEATFTKPAREGGAWVQVSRLGMPLVNEVVIGLKDKDKFNGSHPSKDGQFADYITNPTLPLIIETVFGSANAPSPKTFPRGDLVAAFATGVTGVNSTGATVAEMLRLNFLDTAVAGASGVPGKGAQGFTPGNAQLGAAGCFKPGATDADPKVLDPSLPSCDPFGFPNGRRPGDDVVDIALRVSMGYLLSKNAAPAGDVALGDLVPQNSTQFSDKFPYLNPPNSAD